MAKLKGKSLCKIASKKQFKNNIDDYRKLVKQAKYICLKCGRVAKAKKNLCEPTKL
ncbi:MAG: hypothetical protein JSV33_14795 [bacterium]|nr:MAG: hypothetical protein JSV33_14795 [bacterium]